MASGVCLPLMLCACVCVCVSFNVDTSFPLLKTGADQTLFGLSVALHQDLRTNHYLLLVGAPRERAEPGVPANRTGGVYSCPMTADQSECSRLTLIDPDVNLSEDLIEDMWLGVSVVSQGPPGGRVLACGHRFTKLYGPLVIRQMIGRCYVRGNDLRYHVADMNWQNPEQTCSHRGDVRAEVMCNAGMSASMTENELVIGSPGSYEWQGNVHFTWLNPNDVFHSQKSSFANMKRRSIYIGYCVCHSQRLLSQSDITIVTGAPKDSKEDARGSVLLAVKHVDALLLRQTLRGQQTGSYFGNAVATTDLNNDGWNDLLVGAPFYFQQEAGGAVYVYMNVGGRFNSQPSVVLKGPLGSAFGMTVTAAGDLNQDGFMDFAVGAPFHETGSVMIWSGSRDGITTEPSQVIHGSSVSPRFRTFGYSLSAGIDVDGNQYPDLLIGSLDDTVALLRTRPVIHLNKTLRVFPELIDPNTCHFCIQVEVCFSYVFSTGQESNTHNISIHFSVGADVTSLKPRLRFRRTDQSSISGVITMPKNHCKTLRVGVQSLIKDKVKPLVFSLNASLDKTPHKRGKGLQDLHGFPVLSRRPSPSTTQIHILKACGSDNRCHSNLQMTAQFTDENLNPFSRAVFHFNSTWNRIFLEVNVSNMPSAVRPGEDAHGALLNISSFSPSLIYSGVRTKNDTVASSVECSIQDMAVLCELGNPFKSHQQVQLWIIFQIKDINADTRAIQSVLQLYTLSEQPPVSPVLVSLLLHFCLQTSLSLISSPGSALYGRRVTGGSAVKNTEDIGSQLLFVFQVNMDRPLPGHLGHLEVHFHWPRAVSNGKWLLYLTGIQVEGAADLGCRPHGIIDPLNLMDCLHGARCDTFVCPLVDMKSSATLKLRARVWSATMMEDFADARIVVVKGRASLKLKTNQSNIKMATSSSHCAKFQVMVYPEMGQPLSSGPPWWLLLVSVLAGMALLAFICLLLWKCGFFLRHAAPLYQGRIMGKEEKCFTDTDTFLIQDQGPSTRRH